MFLLFQFQTVYSQNAELNKIRKLISLSFNDSAKVFTKKALKSNLTKNEHLPYYQIEYARILKNLTQTDSSIYFLEQAENYFKNKNNSQLFYINTLKAETYRFLEKRNLANKFIYKAEKDIDKNKNPEYKYYYLNRRLAILAQYYNNVEDSLQKCIAIGNTIMKEEKKVHDKAIIAYTLNEIGFLFFNRDPNKAEPYFIKAYNFAKENDNKVAFIDISLTYGRFIQQKKYNFSKAIAIYNLALLEAKKIKNLWQIQQLYVGLRQTTELKKDFEKAMRYADSVNLINKEITIYNDYKKYELLENKYIIQNKDKELADSKKNFILLIGILALAVMGITVLFIYSRKIQQKNTELDKLYKENEFLLSETNHRVNNNLQLISILISETLRKKQSEVDKNDFIRLQSKVDSIALLHRHLYKGKNVDSINLRNYLHEVKNNFNGFEDEQELKLHFQIDEIEVQSDNAMYLGLLVTELIINSLKYAFFEKQMKAISINILKIQDRFVFKYSDNGQKNKSPEIHPVLAKQLCQQLGVRSEIFIDNGFHLSFTKSIENA